MSIATQQDKLFTSEDSRLSTPVLELIQAQNYYAMARLQAGITNEPYLASVYVFDLNNVDNPVQAGDACLQDPSGIVDAPGFYSASAVLNKLQIEELRTTLKMSRGVDPESRAVVLISNAQPSLLSVARQECVARQLVNEGLLQEGRFFSAYGASAADVNAIDPDSYRYVPTDYNGEPASSFPYISESLRSDTPSAFRYAFKTGVHPIAVLETGMKNFDAVVGPEDTRALASPSLKVMFQAVTHLAQCGNPDVWNIGLVPGRDKIQPVRDSLIPLTANGNESKLYIPSSHVDPLTLLFAVKANIGEIVCVTDAKSAVSWDAAPGMEIRDSVGLLAGGMSSAVTQIDLSKETAQGDGPKTMDVLRRYAGMHLG